MAIRTYGLSGSRMDVDQLVKDLMSARREQYNKVWQKNRSYVQDFTTGENVLIRRASWEGGFSRDHLQ